jgi:hypothetical protein
MMVICDGVTYAAKYLFGALTVYIDPREALAGISMSSVPWMLNAENDGNPSTWAETIWTPSDRFHPTIWQGRTSTVAPSRAATVSAVQVDVPRTRRGAGILISSPVSGTVPVNPVADMRTITLDPGAPCTGPPPEGCPKETESESVWADAVIEPKPKEAITNSNTMIIRRMDCLQLSLTLAVSFAGIMADGPQKQSA